MNYQPQEYRIHPIAVDGFADADGVLVNTEGAWLGRIEQQEIEGVDGGIALTAPTVAPYCDGTEPVTLEVDGVERAALPFIPAPDNWREYIMEELT